MWKWLFGKKRTEGRNFKCPCCGYYTFRQRLPGGICPVCFWELDMVESPEEPSDANHGLTLSQARENYRTLGACDGKSLRFVRKPKSGELTGKDA